MRMKLTIEVELDEAYFFTDEEEVMWFENEILVGDGTLVLYSNEIGDTIGEVKKVSNIKYLTPKP